MIWLCNLPGSPRHPHPMLTCILQHLSPSCWSDFLCFCLPLICLSTVIFSMSPATSWPTSVFFTPMALSVCSRHLRRLIQVHDSLPAITLGQGFSLECNQVLLNQVDSCAPAPMWTCIISFPSFLYFHHFQHLKVSHLMLMRFLSKYGIETLLPHITMAFIFSR